MQYQDLRRVNWTQENEQREVPEGSCSANLETQSVTEASVQEGDILEKEIAYIG